MVSPQQIVSWLGRNITIIALAAAIALLGGFRAEQLATFRAAALAECVALFLSSVALYVYTPDRFADPDARTAKGLIFFGVHLLVGLVYAGSYFVEFAPGG
jgi:ABC-type Co2+ transport system permease subunit